MIGQLQGTFPPQILLGALALGAAMFLAGAAMDLAGWLRSR